MVAYEVVFLAFHGFDELRGDGCCQCESLVHLIWTELFFVAILNLLELAVEFVYFFLDVFRIFFVDYGSF